MPRLSRFLSPAQLTTIVVAVCATAVLAPVGAIAAGSSFSIADPDRPARKAEVDLRGRLSVGDGSGPLSVDGAVTVTPQPGFDITGSASPAPGSQSATVDLVGGADGPIHLTDLSLFVDTGREEPVEVSVLEKRLGTTYVESCADAPAPYVTVAWEGVVSPSAPVQQSFTTPVTSLATPKNRTCLFVRFAVGYNPDRQPVVYADASGSIG